MTTKFIKSKRIVRKVRAEVDGVGSRRRRCGVSGGPPGESPKAGTRQNRVPVLEASVDITPGVCRYCGCTNMTPCAVEEIAGDLIGCYWLDKEHTACSAPECRKKWRRDNRKGGGR